MGSAARRLFATGIGLLRDSELDVDSARPRLIRADCTRVLSVEPMKPRVDLGSRLGRRSNGDGLD